MTGTFSTGSSVPWLQHQGTPAASAFRLQTSEVPILLLPEESSSGVMAILGCDDVYLSHGVVGVADGQWSIAEIPLCSCGIEVCNAHVYGLRDELESVGQLCELVRFLNPLPLVAWPHRNVRAPGPPWFWPREWPASASGVVPAHWRAESGSIPQYRESGTAKGLGTTLPLAAGCVLAIEAIDDEGFFATISVSVGGCPLGVVVEADGEPIYLVDVSAAHLTSLRLQTTVDLRGLVWAHRQLQALPVFTMPERPPRWLWMGEVEASGQPRPTAVD